MLVDKFSSYKKKYANPDDIYAIAINKVIETGRQGESLSIEIFKNYLRRNDIKVVKSIMKNLQLEWYLMQLNNKKRILEVFRGEPL